MQNIHEQFERRRKKKFESKFFIISTWTAVASVETVFHLLEFFKVFEFSYNIKECKKKWKVKVKRNINATDKTLNYARNKDIGVK